MNYIFLLVFKNKNKFKKKQIDEFFTGFPGVHGAAGLKGLYFKIFIISQN